ncbi:MAG: hypothetical protein ACUVV0_07370 [Anaerolineae bacterium]
MSVSRVELLKVSALAGMILALSCLPYLLGYLLAPDGLVFGGFLPFDREDANTYLAVMQQGARGSWRFHLLYTPEEHEGAYIYFFYLALGHLSTALGIPLLLAYQVARVLGGFALLVSAYFFIAYFVRLRVVRWWAFVLVCFSSGLGWLIALAYGSPELGGVSPIDFWLMDAYTFFTLLLFPHFCLAMVMLYWIFIFALEFFRRKSLSAWAGMGGSALILALVNPYVLLIAGAVLGVYWAVALGLRRAFPLAEAGALAGLGFILAPLLTWYWNGINSDPVMRAFSEQDVVPSPSPFHYMAGYGLVFLLALGGAICIIRRRREKELFLIVWLLVVAVGLYMPFRLQRRMITGLHVPLCTLAALGLFRYVLPAVRRSRVALRLEKNISYQRRRLRFLALNLIVMLTFISNIYLLLWAVIYIATGHPAIYHYAAEAEAIDWLKGNSRPEETVLSSYAVGNYIPARVGHRVVWGHWNETINVGEKRMAALAFFHAGTDDEARLEILRLYGVVYLFYGPREREMGDFKPEGKPYLAKVFSNGEVTIYRVEQPADR